MSKDLKNIDQLFYSNLKGAQDAPPSHIWEGITDALDLETQPIPIVTETQQLSNQWRRVAAIVILLTGSMLLYNRSTQPATTKLTIAKNILTKDNAKKLLPEKVEAINSLELKQSSKSAITNITGLTNINNVPASAGHVDLESSSEQYHLPIIIPAIIADNRLTEIVPVNHINEQLVPMTLLPAETSELRENDIVHSINKKEAFLKRFSLTAFFAPDITTRNLEQNNNASPDENKDEISRTEKSKALDFTIGVRINYKLNNHFSVESGASFSSNTISIAPKTIFARYDVDGIIKYRLNCSSGYVFFKPTTAAPLQAGDSTQALASTTVLHYVNIPIALKYSIHSGRFNLFVQAGIAARFITKHSIASVYAIGNTRQNTTDQIQGLKTSYFNGVVGLGADYSLSEHLAISLFPSFNFATTSINRNSPVKAYPNTFSIASGIKFNF